MVKLTEAQFEKLIGGNKVLLIIDGPKGMIAEATVEFPPSEGSVTVIIENVKSRG